MWPNLWDINLLDITLEYPSNSFSLNHDSVPMVFIHVKPLSLLGLLEFFFNSFSITAFILHDRVHDDYNTDELFPNADIKDRK